MDQKDEPTQKGRPSSDHFSPPLKHRPVLKRRYTTLVGSILLGVLISFTATFFTVFTTDRPGGSDSAQSPAPLDPEITSFLMDCAKGVAKWQAGQIHYPHSLTVDMGESTSYIIAIDMRNNPPSVETLIPDEDLRTAPIAVQCVVAAKLNSVGESLEVDRKGWSFREFTPTGVVNWSWSVKATAPNGHDLRLEVQPAVTLRPGGLIVADEAGITNKITFLTQVEVKSSAIQRVDQWWKNNWGAVSAIAGTLGMAVIAIIKWGGSLAQAVNEASANRKGK